MDKRPIPICYNSGFKFCQNAYKSNKMLHSTLCLDFIISLPRTAVLLMQSPSKTMEFVIKNTFQEGIFCFGPFLPEKFFHLEIYKIFDATLVVTNEPIDFISHFINNETNPLFISNLSYIITLAGQTTALQQAIYLAMDIYIYIYRNRKANQELQTMPQKTQLTI